jgi:formamidopyrimidine-DNA glycosylase
MPELPDVEGFRRVLARYGAGRRIERVEVLDAGVLHDVDALALRAALIGRSFGQPDRHGKWLLAHTDGPTVLLHFGMTGDLRWCPRDEPRHRHDRVVFGLDGGELRYRDMRKLQGVRLVHDAEALERTLSDLGPDALAVRPRELDGMLAGRRGAVKAVLVDQSLLAGLGNLLTDEILWRARVNPRRPAHELAPDQRRRVYDEMRSTLRASIRAGRVPPRHTWLTGVRDEPRGRCPRCHTPLARGRVGGRGTVWCPRCQPVGG